VPIIVDLREDLERYIQKHGLSKKWEIDIKYRALFICLPNNRIEIIAITKHYHK
jgi:hypothetical protein